ncbi:MAG: hypothetical protein Tsb0034_29480 [Ekhidna sp.]
MAKRDVKKIGKKMEKSKAKKWVKKYQKEHKGGTHGWLYGADILETLLKYEGAEGIWFFKGTNDEGEERLVLFPADADGNVLDKNIKSLGAAAGGDNEFEPGDFGQDCPPHCPIDFP